MAILSAKALRGDQYLTLLSHAPAGQRTETQPDLVCQTRQGQIEPQLYRGCDLVDVLPARS